MDKILITGGTGYIGSHTAVELINAGYEVEILDNLANSKASVIDRIFEITGVRPVFHQVDLLDSSAVLKVFKEGSFSSVIHFAGLKAVAESVEKPLLYYENNVGGTLNLLKAMYETGVSRIVFSSSATVYGDIPIGGHGFTEDMPTGRGITNPYGRTKYMIEEILKDICISDPTFSATILRYFNPIGAHPSGLIGEDPNGIPNNLMPLVMRVARKEMPELSVFGNDYETPDGTCIRDYIHIVDLAKGHLAALSHAEPGVAIYNLGTGRGTSVLEMVAAFEKASGESLPYRTMPRRAGDLPIVFADVSKAFSELGFKATLSVDDAMRDTLKFLRNQ
ncbi:UDP-glucose 4-epimerase GalE [Candidatus Saccharibacteria bacterium]|nr:UDP-glucose 4-epimerase GalE [Candidatus Saccharibacteria bacterium]